MHSRAIGFCSCSGRFAGLRAAGEASHHPIYMVLTQNVAKMLLLLKEGIAS